MIYVRKLKTRAFSIISVSSHLQQIHCVAHSHTFVCARISLPRHVGMFFLFFPPDFTFPSSSSAAIPPPTAPSCSLHSMRVTASKLCLPLPLLRLNTLPCPSQPAPRWTMERWRRSWMSAGSCRWRCRGYEKKTNRSGWDMLEQAESQTSQHGSNKYFCFIWFRKWLKRNACAININESNVCISRR